jgi:PPK2 family polyphosphate:nucleotide phosphotransferase
MPSRRVIMEGGTVNHDQFRKHFIVPPGTQVSLAKDYDPGFVAHYTSSKHAAKELEAGVLRLADYQDMLYAQDQWSLLIIFQAIDAAGKDSTIKHVMSGLNPQGTQVASFKAPVGEETDHDYLWRCVRHLPERGRIGIFNRSYYEEVVVVRVHPEFLAAQKLPVEMKDEGIWKRRFREINSFERYLSDNGTRVLKFFLNVSKTEQKKRFLERIEKPEKNWKFSAQDVKERAHWDEYMAAFEDMLSNTSTEIAPWYVIPADHKWFSRIAVANIITLAMDGLDLAYPTLTDAQRAALLEAKVQLDSED